MERESIAKQRKLTGPVGITEYIEYPDLAPSLDNLAGLLLRKGNVVEAESLFREALPIYRKFLGNNHVYIANALDHLAAALSKQGKQAEAEDCLRESISIRKKLFGENDSSTIKTSQSLNELLKQKGKSTEAAKQSPQATKPEKTVPP